MPITIQCRACGASREFADAMSGQTVRCGNCAERIRLPGVRPKPALPERPAPDSSRLLYRHDLPALCGAMFTIDLLICALYGVAAAWVATTVLITARAVVPPWLLVQLILVAVVAFVGLAGNACCFARSAKGIVLGELALVLVLVQLALGAYSLVDYLAYTRFEWAAGRYVTIAVGIVTIAVRLLYNGLYYRALTAFRAHLAHNRLAREQAVQDRDLRSEP